MARFTKFLLGGAIGAGLALLFAPKPGKELRRMLLGGGRPALPPPEPHVEPSRAPAKPAAAPAPPEPAVVDLESRLQATRRQVEEQLAESVAEPQAPGLTEIESVVEFTEVEAAEVEAPEVEEAPAAEETAPVEEAEVEAPAEEAVEAPLEAEAQFYSEEAEQQLGGEMLAEELRETGAEPGPGLPPEPVTGEGEAEPPVIPGEEAPMPSLAEEANLEEDEFAALKTPAEGEPQLEEPTREEAPPEESAIEEAPSEEPSAEEPQQSEPESEAVTEEAPQAAAGQQPRSIDQVAMRRRIDETRARLKAKAFDAMVSGETFIETDADREKKKQQRGGPELDKETEEAIEESFREEY